MPQTEPPAASDAAGYRVDGDVVEAVAVAVVVVVAVAVAVVGAVPPGLQHGHAGHVGRVVHVVDAGHAGCAEHVVCAEHVGQPVPECVSGCRLVYS